MRWAGTALQSRSATRALRRPARSRHAMRRGWWDQSRSGIRPAWHLNVDDQIRQFLIFTVQSSLANFPAGGRVDRGPHRGVASSCVRKKSKSRCIPWNSSGCADGRRQRRLYAGSAMPAAVLIDVSAPHPASQSSARWRAVPRADGAHRRRIDGERQRDPPTARRDALAVPCGGARAADCTTARARAPSSSGPQQLTLIVLFVFIPPPARACSRPTRGTRPRRRRRR